MGYIPGSIQESLACHTSQLAECDLTTCTPPVGYKASALRNSMKQTWSAKLDLTINTLR